MRVHIRRKGAVALVTAVLAAGAGCGPSTAAQPSPSPAPSVAPTPTPSPAPDCAQQVLDSLSLEQRAGQLIMLGLAGDRLGPAELAAIQGSHIGSVWFTHSTADGAVPAKAVADSVQALASPAATGGVRFFVAANQEGGNVQALNGPGFSRIPSAQVQGGLDPVVLESSAQAWAAQMVVAGFNFNFAPVLDVVPPGTDALNQPIGAFAREYGHDPVTAGVHGAAFIRGMRAAGIQVSAKHFPGLGRVTGNTDFTAQVVDQTTTATDPYLESFRTGITAGAGFVMVALATYTRIDPAHLAAFSPTVMTLLRGPLGFQGVILSDDLGATAAVANIPAGTRAIDFLAAGGDLAISQTVSAAEAMTAAITARASSDTDFRMRVDDATLRVLRAKRESGLLPCSQV